MIQTRICRTCGAVFQGGPRAYYCPACGHERTRKTNASYRKRLKAGATRVGKQDICERCGSAYTVEAGLQRFCKACRKAHNQEHDRTTSLAFYRENRERINPQRNARRRIALKICIVCGKEFKSFTCTTTCSSECRRIARNRNARKYYPKIAERKKATHPER